MAFDLSSPTVAEFVQAKAVFELSLADYSMIRQIYAFTIKAAINEYLFTDGVKITRFRNQMKRAIADAFDDAFAQGFADGGGGEYPDDADEAAHSWLAARIDAELGYVDLLFNDLREQKKLSAEENDPGLIAGLADQRAEGYAKSLDGVYNQAKMYGGRDKMLTFGGMDGGETCTTCQKLKGQRHKASWWVRRGLVPGQPGNTHFECGGWQCDHFLYDDNGQIFTS